MSCVPNPSKSSAAASGSRILRDAFVFAMACLILAPALVLFPRAAAGVLCFWLLAFFTPLPAAILRRLDHPEHRRRGPARIAVLAGGFSSSGQLSERTHRRLRYGIELAHTSGAELILCGGALSNERTEAEAMAGLARDLGFAGPLLIEPCSRSTVENLLCLSRFPASAAAPEHQPILVVTCPQHLPRVRRIARAVTLTPPPMRLLPVAYPVERLPAGPGGRLALAAECLYECLVYSWLTLRVGLSQARLLRPLSALDRPHLFKK